MYQRLFILLQKHRQRNELTKALVLVRAKTALISRSRFLMEIFFIARCQGKDTDGDLYIFESTRDKEGGPPLHYHYNQDEWWFILSGEFLVKIGEQTYTAKAGDSVFGPRGVPHTFSKVGEGEGRLIILFQPAGKMEEFFKAVSEGIVGKMNEDERNAFRKAHGFEHVGPPLTKLKAP